MLSRIYTSIMYWCKTNKEKVIVITSVMITILIVFISITIHIETGPILCDPGDETCYARARKENSKIRIYFSPEKLLFWQSNGKDTREFGPFDQWPNRCDKNFWTGDEHCYVDPALNTGNEVLSETLPDEKRGGVTLCNWTRNHPEKKCYNMFMDPHTEPPFPPTEVKHRTIFSFPSS